MKRSQEIWILGAGRLGRRAAESLRQKYPRAGIVLINSSGKACAQMDSSAFTVICREGVDYLFENLKEGRSPDFIVPMIPVHVTYEWMRLKLKKTHRIRPVAVPPEVFEKLPNPIRGADGQAYMTNATFICPWNCPEPDDICTHTGKPRPQILHRFLENIAHPEFRSMVVKSLQLAPGIGGYSPAVLFQALKTVASENDSVLLSTACRCHGVMHAFRTEAL
ncbi:MAG: potassium transporter [Desulfobacterales bacterium]|nr:potassium transporter [Desulfobacterales bacterium]